MCATGVSGWVRVGQADGDGGAGSKFDGEETRQGEWGRLYERGFDEAKVNPNFFVSFFILMMGV